MTTEHSLQPDKPRTGKGSGRGGARKGAGRKPSGRVSVKIRLSAQERALLDKKRGAMRMSAFIRAELGLESKLAAAKKI